MTQSYIFKARRRIDPLVLNQCRATIDHGLATSTIVVSDFDDEQDDDHTPRPRHPICDSSPPQQRTLMSPAAMFLSSFSAPTSPTLPPDAEGAVVGGYTLGPIIGYGGFSIIRRAFSTSGGTVAVKIVRRSDLARQTDPVRARKQLDRESEVWGTLSHEHVLPLFSVTRTSHADYFFTLYCPAGTLFDILKRDGRPALPQDEAGMMFRQVVRGLRYLHEVAGLVHRDIKPENVLVDEMGNCKIGDFGMSVRIDEMDGVDEEEDDDHQEEEQPPPPPPPPPLLKPAPLLPPRSHRRAAAVVASLRSEQSRQHRKSAPPSSMTPPLSPPSVQPGSLPYAAPELLLPRSPGGGGKQQPHPTAHPAQDIWALGVLLYVLLTGKLPFTDAFEPRLQMKILLGDYVVPTGIGRGAETVLQGCLERGVGDRWTIDMVDDVAWGIGWGNEANEISSPIEEFVRTKRRRRRRSTRASLLGRESAPPQQGPSSVRKMDNNGLVENEQRQREQQQQSSSSPSQWSAWTTTTMTTGRRRSPSRPRTSHAGGGYEVRPTGGRRMSERGRKAAATPEIVIAQQEQEEEQDVLMAKRRACATMVGEERPWAVRERERDVQPGLGRRAESVPGRSAQQQPPPPPRSSSNSSGTRSRSVNAYRHAAPTFNFPLRLS